MKRNRVKYLIYLEPWIAGRHRVVYSKFQMKKVLRYADKGSEAMKQRLIHGRDGGVSFSNIDFDYPFWVVV